MVYIFLYSCVDLSSDVIAVKREASSHSTTYLDAILCISISSLAACHPLLSYLRRLILLSALHARHHALICLCFTYGCYTHVLELDSCDMMVCMYESTVPIYLPASIYLPVCLCV